MVFLLTAVACAQPLPPPPIHEHLSQQRAAFASFDGERVRQFIDLGPKTDHWLASMPYRVWLWYATAPCSGELVSMQGEEATVTIQCGSAGAATTTWRHGASGWRIVDLPSWSFGVHPFGEAPLPALPGPPIAEPPDLGDLLSLSPVYPAGTHLAVLGVAPGDCSDVNQVFGSATVRDGTMTGGSAQIDHRSLQAYVLQREGQCLVDIWWTPPEERAFANVCASPGCRSLQRVLGAYYEQRRLPAGEERATALAREILEMPASRHLPDEFLRRLRDAARP